MNKEYKEYLNSKEWSEIKLDLYANRGKKCERCRNTKFLQVHHKHYRNIFKEEPEDLEILCNACHKKEHGIGEKPKQVKKTKRFQKLKTKKKLSLAQKVELIKTEKAKRMKSKNRKFKKFYKYIHL
jgi:5-methylcytosine-specific restriction endonuclease McrA